jgi:hypothetical protein
MESTFRASVGAGDILFCTHSFALAVLLDARLHADG